jgi:hypothetical protein
MDKAPLLSRQEIIDLASRYTSPEEIVDFPHNSDFFCLLQRVLPDNAVLADDKGWAFAGYGICTGYVIDETEIPAGKWLWMRFVSLAAFPPVSQTLKLQPPHVAKGRFQSSDRKIEFCILKITTGQVHGADGGLESTVEPFVRRQTGRRRSAKRDTGKIVEFRKKGDAKRE